jgi:hypothetical protein
LLAALSVFNNKTLGSDLAVVIDYPDAYKFFVFVKP